MYSIFVNLKATFDNVEREKLWRILKEKGNDKELRRRLRKMYEGYNDSYKNKGKNYRGIRDTEESKIRVC